MEGQTKRVIAFLLMLLIFGVYFSVCIFLGLKMISNEDDLISFIFICMIPIALAVSYFKFRANRLVVKRNFFEFLIKMFDAVEKIVPIVSNGLFYFLFFVSLIVVVILAYLMLQGIIGLVGLIPFLLIMIIVLLLKNRV